MHPSTYESTDRLIVALVRSGLDDADEALHAPDIKGPALSDPSIRIEHGPDALIAHVSFALNYRVSALAACDAVHSHVERHLDGQAHVPRVILNVEVRDLVLD